MLNKIGDMRYAKGALSLHRSGLALVPVDMVNSDLRSLEKVPFSFHEFLENRFKDYLMQALDEELPFSSVDCMFTLEHGALIDKLESYGVPIQHATAFVLRTHPQVFQPHGFEQFEANIALFFEKGYELVLQETGDYPQYLTLDGYFGLVETLGASATDYFMESMGTLPQGLVPLAASVRALEYPLTLQGFDPYLLSIFIKFITVDPGGFRSFLLPNQVAMVDELMRLPNHSRERIQLNFSSPSLLFVDLAQRIDGLVTRLPSGEPMERFRNYSKMLAAIIGSYYGEQCTLQALKLYDSHEQLFSKLSSERLNVLLSYLDFVSSGGDVSWPSHWIVSLSPLVDQRELYHGASEIPF